MNEETMSDDHDMREHYDFTDGVRGKYYQRFKAGTNIVLLDKDVAEVFKDAKQVNDILRALIPTVSKKAS